MSEETLIFGPPGCGKTHTMINIVREELQRGTPPDRIGFVSFSRKSIEEARHRVGKELRLKILGSWAVCSVYPLTPTPLKLWRKG